MKPQNGRNMVEGKTKVIEPLWNNMVRMLSKDEVTGNDAAIREKMRGIGTERTEQTANVFTYLQKHGVPCAFQKQETGTSIIADECDMIPLECVARRQPYGSFLKRHPEKSSHELFNPPLLELFHKWTVVTPVKEHKLNYVIRETPNLILESTARDLFMDSGGNWEHEVYCDPLILIQQEDSWELHKPKSPKTTDTKPLMTIEPVLKKEEVELIKSHLHDTFTLLETAWKKVANVSLIDMKIEFGRKTKDGQIVVADVIDNDSWRIWPSGDPKKQLDKQSFRDGEELSEVDRKYRIVTEYTKDFANLS